MSANAEVTPALFETPPEKVLIAHARKLIWVAARPAPTRLTDYFAIPPMLPDEEEVRDRVRQLVLFLGEVAQCRACHAAIWFIRMKPRPGGPAEGRLNPFDRDAVSHFATCPKAAEFRRRRPNG